jgi:hypothetical protein
MKSLVPQPILCFRLRTEWGIVYGGIIYKNQAFFGGYNSEKTLHKVQNAIHDTNLIRSPHFYDFNYKSSSYGYFGRYNSNYLYY